MDSQSHWHDFLLLLKIPMILSTAIAMNICLTPPQPPPSADERIGKFARSPEVTLARILKIGYWGMGLAEIATILASLNPSNDLSKLFLKSLVHTPQNPEKVLGFSSLFVLGWFLTTVGAVIRWKCYRILGKQFTFELSIRKDHKLITSGPYSVVRHPSYIGLTFAGIGSIASHLNGASWFVRCSGLIHDSPLHFLLLWAFGFAVGILIIAPRLGKEDKMMREQFGDQWERWAKKVPYRLIPGIY